jgi:hypothetical protein
MFQIHQNNIDFLPKGSSLLSEKPPVSNITVILRNGIFKIQKFIIFLRFHISDVRKDKR